jgi:hypothetical protein
MSFNVPELSRQQIIHTSYITRACIQKHNLLAQAYFHYLKSNQVPFYPVSKYNHTTSDVQHYAQGQGRHD